MRAISYMTPNQIAAIRQELLFSALAACERQRIAEFFAGNHEKKEKINFLKKVYGYRGHSPIRSAYWFDYSPTGGMQFRRDHRTEHTAISWSKVADLIDGLIAEGIYGGQA